MRDEEIRAKLYSGGVSSAIDAIADGYKSCNPDVVLSEDEEFELRKSSAADRARYESQHRRLAEKGLHNPR